MARETAISEQFTRIYDLYYTKCVQFALSYTHDLSDAQDIVAEAMLVLWLKMNDGEDVKLVLPFLFGVIRNKILQYFRSRMIRTRIDEDIRTDREAELNLRLSSLSECDPYQLYFTEVNSILERSLQQMSEKTRTIFNLSRSRQMSNSEIAKAMGLGVKSVEYHITRALKKLRKDMGDYHVSLILGFTASIGTIITERLYL